MTPTKNEQIELYLNKICEDKTFATYQRYKDLLTFITTESRNDNYIKEFNIAVRLYGENFSEEKSDGRVRVYMHNLRKKLDRYYEESGKDDELIFVLEKGSYNIQFKNRIEEPLDQTKDNYLLESTSSATETKSQPRNTYRRWHLYITAIVLALILFSIHILTQDKEIYCWESFLYGDTPTLCILADRTIVESSKDSLCNGIVHRDIKTVSMYYDYIATNPNDSLRLSNYSFYSKGVPYSLQRLTEWFANYGRRFSLTPESEFTIESIKTSNLIYLGSYRVMDISRRIFLRNSKIFTTDNQCIYVNKDDETTRYGATFTNKVLTEEYALVSYVRLNSSTNALYFSSNHDIGTMATLNNFTDIDFLKEFYEQLPSTDSYFNALFRVEGIGRTDITCTLIELEIL